LSGAKQNKLDESGHSGSKASLLRQGCHGPWPYLTGNILIARYSPSRHRGLAYGIRHFAGFVAAPLGVQMVAWFYGWFAGFTWLFVALGSLVLIALLAALMLPGEGPADAIASRSSA